jgi:muramidase (phage lysozyme)
MAIGKGLNAFLAAYYKAKESASKDVYQAIQLAYLMNKLGGGTPKGEDAEARAAGTAAQGAYDKGGGGLREGRSAAVGDPVSTDMAPHQRAFLNAVAAPESGGEYDRMYAGMGRDVPPTYFEGYDQHPDISAPGPAGPSTAAGRYMFTKSTWDRMGGGAFDPANQDKRAWELAKQDYAERTGGRDLDKELRTNGFTPQIASTLSPTWTGFKANPSLAANTYYSSLNRYAQPQVAEGVPTGTATPALSAARTPPARSDNLGQALPVEAGVTAPTPLAYAPEAYPQAIPVDYAAYDPYNTEAVYAAKGGLVPDLRQQWRRALPVQHFQGGGDVLPQFTYVDPYAPWAGQSPEPPPDQPPQFTYVDPNAPWAGQPMVNNPYGDLTGPRGSPVGPQDFAPATTTPMYSPYGALPLTPASFDSPDVPLPPARPAGLGAAPAGGGGARRVPMPPPRPDDFQATTAAGAQDQGWNGQISPDNPIAQLLTGVEHAVSGGVRWLTKNLGFNNDAIPTSGDGLRALANGDHALTEEEHNAVVNKVDPDNRLSPGIRNMVGMNAMYDYYLTHGSLDKAQKMAAGMLLYSEQYLRKAGYAALNDPNPDSAAKKLADGFNQVPNNQHMTVDNNGNFVFKNETTGKVINAGRYNPQQLLAAATGAANGSVFWQSLSQFAHKDDEVDDKQTAAMKKAQQEQENLSNFHQTFTPGGNAAPDQAIPAGGTEFKALAPDGDTESQTEDAGEGGEATEGRSASQGVPTAAAAPAGAPPKGAPRTATSAAYVGMKPALPDNFTAPEHWAAWDKLTPQQKALEQRFHELRINTAAEAAKREAQANAPDAPIKRTQAGADKIQEQVDSAYIDHIEELKDKKDESGKPLPVPPPSAARSFKGIAREIAKANPDTSGADAVDKTTSLVEFNPSKGVPYKVDKDRNGWFARMNDTGEEVRLTPSGKVQLQRIVNAKIASADAAKQAAEKGSSTATAASTGVMRAGEGVGDILAERQAVARQAAAQMARRPVAPTAPVVAIPNPFGNAPATGAVMVPPRMPNPTYVVPRRALPVIP